MEYNLPTNVIEAIKLIAQCEFIPFDEADRAIFPGVESEYPTICYMESGSVESYAQGLVVVQDGDSFTFTKDEGDGEIKEVRFTFEMTKS